MNKAAIDRQTQLINNSFEKDVHYIDLNYKVVEPAETKRGVTLHYGNVILNKLKIWLLSSSTDFIRNPGYAGFFDNQLNRYPFNTSSESLIASDLSTQIVSLFPYMEVIACVVTCEFEKRTWRIKLMVRDTLTGIVAYEEEGIPIDAKTN